MNKYFFRALALLFSLTILYSCNKDSKIVPDEINNTNEYTADEMALWNQLNNFNLKIKNGLKSEEFISPDSAIWYLEALFNVQNAVGNDFEESKTYKRDYALSISSNGMVDLSEIADLNDQMIEDLNYELDLIDADNKFLFVADLKKEALKNDSVKISFKGVLARKPASLYYPIDSTDNWRYGNNLGRCENTQWDSDAGKELKRRFNNPYIAYPFPVYHDTTSTGWINIDNSNVLDYTTSGFEDRIYHELATSPPCIEHDELLQLLIDGHYIIYNKANESPSGVRIDGLDFKYFELWTNNPNPPDNIYKHNYQVWYGNPVRIPPITD